MFYSQFILAKKGPLGTIWIAAHLERKLRKNQVADTDIGVSVDSILFPDVPIALRLSSHLLLGVVRIYNRKVNYLFDDCSEALLKVKQAFRSTAVDLPPEESKAPYHSITLPEKFDLDDFELPDSDIFKGNYVDHHISSREQITLQDSMEGVSYSTSKFGLDERFGDGDASGLDLDEELFLNKIETAGDADESADPQACYKSMPPLKQDEHPEDGATNSETMADGADGADEPVDLMDYAQAPRTPVLVEEPNNNAKDASACDDHLESEYHLMESTLRESGNNVPYEDKQEVDLCFRDDTISGVVPQGQHAENVHLASGMEIKESEPQGESPIEGQDEVIRPTSEFIDRIKVSDVSFQEDSPIEAVKEDKIIVETIDNHRSPIDVGLEKSEITGLVNTDKQISEGVSAKEDLASPRVEVPNCVGDISNKQKSCDDGSKLASGNQVESVLETPETQACQETTNFLNLEAHDKEVASVTLVENPDVTKPGDSISTNAEVKSDTAVLETYGREETMEPDKECCINISSKPSVTENQVQEHTSGEDIRVTIGEADAQVHSTNSQDNLVENLNNITEPELPAPEKLLSVPEGHMDLHIDMLVEVSPSAFAGLDTGDAGSKNAAGKKRSFTESTLTEQSLNSVESCRHACIKRVKGSVPDDDDLLSSILVGRKSSVLKVKPTPRLTEVTSMKRCRAIPRSSASKRKVLIDDTMVLHGDTIRHQLTNTEDIRRVRKKAPCTFAEITMIQKQQMEDAVFLGTIFTGVSVELASLHGHAYDLSRISVCKDDVNGASLETVTEASQPPQDVKNDASLETISEPNLASLDDRYGASLETLDRSHLLPLNNGNHDKGPGISNNVIEISQQGVNDELLIVKDSEITGPSENSLLNENLPEEVNHTSTDGASLETLDRSHLLPPNNGNHDKGPGNSNDVIEISEQGVNDELLIVKGSEITGPSENSLLNENLPGEVNHTSADGASLETLDRSHLLPPSNRNHDKGPGNSNNIIEISKQGVNDELLIVKDSEITGPSENSLLNENLLEEVNHTSTDVNLGQEQTKPTSVLGPDDSQQELLVNVAEIRTSLINTTASENPSVISEVGPLDSIGHATGDMGDASACMVQTDSLNEFGERNSHVNMDASAVVLSVGLDYADIEDGQAITRNEVVVKNGDANGEGETELGAKDDILPDVVEIAPNANHGELEHNFEAQVYNIISEEQREVDFSHEAVVSVPGNDLMNNGENPNLSEAYQANMMDAEVSGFDLNDRDDINYSAAGNDTEFLNVDDDELAEIADDHMPDDEEREYTENSGWSSRTRAVSKYLQTAFTKEAECGKNSLSMYNLLTGKSRKEVSRMFFETLVLKTRDYIHVEQPNPCGDITIRPRTRLMKSDF